MDNKTQLNRRLNETVLNTHTMGNATVLNRQVPIWLDKLLAVNIR